MAIGIGILVSIYSIFFPLITNLWEVGNFNIAYYGAISSVERWELVLKYRQPGFEWSGGYRGDIGRWPISDNKTGAFGFINDNDNNGISRTISSRTNTIPNSWEWNVEYLLAAPDSTNYNMLDYKTAEKILLSYDKTADPANYYNWITDTEYFNGGQISGEIRIPPKVFSWFGDQLLCDSCDENGDGIKDDIVVDRSLEWTKNWMYFKIIPNQSIFYYSGAHVDTSKDMGIRKSIINNTGQLLLWLGAANQFNPIKNIEYNASNVSWHVVIASTPENVENDQFSTILLNVANDYTGLELNLWLVTLLKATNDIYPFLEYRLWFTAPVSNRFYTIQGNGHVGDYDVQIVIKKPTAQWSVAGSFTVIF